MLLQTKFLAPAYNPNSVVRSHLLERLAPRGARKLALVSAPAGYGKTTLVLQWLNSHDKDFCWLSLDETDDQTKRFWQYLTGSIASVINHFGEQTMALLEGDTPVEAAVTALVNELNEQTISGKSLTIILDDFHVIREPEILRSFAYFVDFLPPSIDLMITSRFEPNLPISRWSVKNWVDHVSSNDLIFSFDEAKSFFNEYMGLALSDKQVEQIYSKTEGWIAAMQLTALSAVSTPSNEQRFLPTDQLLSEDRHFSDYVLSEILDHQPPQVREFLLNTACLLRLSAPLCDEIRQSHDSQDILEHLLNANLFLIPLDKENRWFRYHEMFREALLKRVRLAEPEKLMQLQVRAVTWLIDNEQPHEAIEQVVQLRDWSLLASLLEKNGNNLIHEGHHLPMLKWLSLLPESKVESSPRLIMLKIWALFFSNKLDIIPPLLDELENLIDQQRLENVATSPNELIDLHSEISLIRSYLARTQSDLRSATELTKQVLEELDHTNMPLKSVTYYGIGLDSFTVGDLESAEKALLSAIEHGKREKKFTTILSSSGLLGWIYFYQGKLELALETGIQNQRWNVSYTDPSQPRVISCWQNTVLAMIYIELGEFTIAESYINPLLKHLELGTEPGLHILIQYTRAAFNFAQQQYVDAIACLDDAYRVFQHKREVIVFEPPSISALKARCLLGMHKIDKAEQVLNELDSATINAIPLNYEDINLTRARLYLEQQKYPLVVEMTERLIDQAREKKHIYHLIQALALQAIAHHQMDHKDAARTAITEALLLASQDGFISLFTNENQRIASVLSLGSDPNIPDAYLQKLSNALGMHIDKTPLQVELPGAAAIESNIQLLEPLSQRELEVLQLIDQGLANKEIAQKLSLAPATVKAHIRNLYGKINAKSRTEALSKARQIGII
ncbi:MAG: LuxR C-terminal-related transcriptional regulator [Oleiphilaceae bacterium]|nr:LuxR C-terminal-related transcriptional regulator [Oleiphilaceae bacterium]